MLSIWICYQQIIVFKADCLKVTFYFELCMMLFMLLVSQTKIHLDFVFEEFQGNNVCYWFSSLFLLVFLMKFPILYQGWGGPWGNDSTLWQESMWLHVQGNSAGVLGVPFSVQTAALGMWDQNPLVLHCLLYGTYLSLVPVELSPENVVDPNWDILSL